MTVSLTRLELLLAEATERPWWALDVTIRSGTQAPPEDDEDEFGWYAWFDQTSVVNYGDIEPPDAALIAEAVNALPALIAAVKAARELGYGPIDARMKRLNDALAAFSFEAEA